eukprot:TRINITY_DN3945_c0_g2_i1.p1 TRINITY_DN3945_c0_g2~~TRINITY_DN3945_c0_g2_i1.p1  ORF type:complete len:395 (-),score=25.43 TRINITY_DN3945_c0_g2_i1:119-1303(-)
MTLIQKKSMKQTRKEHSAVLLQNYIYVLGGYDGKTNSFLSSCERYSVEREAWETISPMRVAKCAFGATTVNDKYIFTVGGYDGSERLSTIERYDAQTDRWTVLEVTLRESLSNSACFSPKQNHIVILGGGFSHGFSLEVDMLNISTGEWSKLPRISDGRDLRNKIVFYKQNIYAIGGNNCNAEKFSFAKGEWQTLNSYILFVNDNLDSWSSAMCFDLPSSGSSVTGNDILTSSPMLSSANSANFSRGRESGGNSAQGRRWVSQGQSPQVHPTSQMNNQHSHLHHQLHAAHVHPLHHQLHPLHHQSSIGPRITAVSDIRFNPGIMNPLNLGERLDYYDGILSDDNDDYFEESWDARLMTEEAGGGGQSDHSHRQVQDFDQLTIYKLEDHHWLLGQ